MKNMELRIEKSVYSFMSREGEEDSALRINEGKFKGTIYQYSNIILPREQNEILRLSFYQKKITEVLGYPLNLTSLTMQAMQEKSMETIGLS